MFGTEALNDAFSTFLEGIRNHVKERRQQNDDHSESLCKQYNYLETIFPLYKVKILLQNKFALIFN